MSKSYTDKRIDSVLGIMKRCKDRENARQYAQIAVGLIQEVYPELKGMQVERVESDHLHPVAVISWYEGIDDYVGRLSVNPAFGRHPRMKIREYKWQPPNIDPRDYPDVF